MLFGLGSHHINQALVHFGRPSHITGFWRVLRGNDVPGFQSETEDTWRIVLQYADRPWLEVTISTTIVSTMVHSFRYLIQGRDGTFVKYGVDPQEEQILSGMSPTDPNYGWEEEDRWGDLTTKKQVLPNQVKQRELWSGDLWVGKLKSERGRYGDFYADLAKTIRDGAPLVIDPKDSRDALKVAELARESAILRRTLEFA